ncbi:cytidine deaminase-like protein [Trametopsis cervina]|nr:cytidine deaminase-like protein [Trametopsis cervina]
MDAAQNVHLEMLEVALEEAQKCTPSPTAFCVGAVITLPVPSSSKPIILATGYSRELEGNTHAEANALTKLRSLLPAELHQLVPHLPAETAVADVLAQADIYTTMEPCSVRTSGLAPCADAIVAARMRRCFIGVGEPDDFVQCEGAQRLKDAGIEVVWVKGLEKRCLEVARAGR